VRIAGRLGALIIASVGAATALGCVGDDLPCNDALGFGVVSVPRLRVGSIERVTAAGPANCTIFTEADDCDAGGCMEGYSGVKVKKYYVSAGAEGACTVTFEFSDGCPASVVDLTFGGAINNCCANTCTRSGSTQLPEDCRAN